MLFVRKKILNEVSVAARRQLVNFGRKFTTAAASAPAPAIPSTQAPVQRSATRKVLSFVGKTSLAGLTLGAGWATYKLHERFGSWANTADAGQRFFRTMYNGAVITADYKYLDWRYPDMDSEEYKQAAKLVHLHTGKRILDVCLAQGGLYIKVGQYMSTQNHVSPKEYTEQLRVLHDQVTTREFTDMQEIFIEDLGANPEQIFQSFDQKPIAAASIAQVHHAVTKDGREVAVKIQYPEIRRRFDIDIFTHNVVLDLLAFFFPKLDMSFFAEEMTNLLRQELDFLTEGKNAEKAMLHFKGNPDAYVPKVYWDLTSDRVLTLEFIHGCKVTDLAGLKKFNITPKDAANKTLNALASQVFESGFLHGDPHPGNVFVRPNPTNPRRGAQVVLLDHGLYKQLPDDVRVQFCQLYKALVLNDYKQIELAAKAMGVNNWRMLAFMVLLRPLDASDFFDDSVSLAKRKDLLANKTKFMQYLQTHFQSKQEEMLDLMKSLPRDLLLVFRNNNLIRSLNHDLGVPVNRFTIFARHSIKGLENSKLISMSRWREWLHFEYKMFSWDLRYWIEGVVLRMLQVFGIVSKDFSQEGAAIDEDAMQIEAMPLQTSNNDELLAVK